MLGKKDYMFVGIQLVLLFAIAFIGERNFTLPIWMNYILLSICFASFVLAVLAIYQLRRSLSPFPTPRKDTVLKTDGLFALVRHPIYLLILLFCFSWGIYHGSWFKFTFSLLLVALFYFKSAYEEEKLSTQFQDYEAYQKTTGRLFPKMKILSRSNSGKP